MKHGAIYSERAKSLVQLPVSVNVLTSKIYLFVVDYYAYVSPFM